MIQLKRVSIILTIIFLVIPQYCFGQIEKEDWDRADSLTARLSPTEFEDLPGNIVQYLFEKGCIIPQSWCHSEPENVIFGSFQKLG